MKKEESVKNIEVRCAKCGCILDVFVDDKRIEDRLFQLWCKKCNISDFEIVACRA